VTCRSCGTQNVPGAPTCARCNAPLTEAAGDAPPQGPPPPAGGWPPPQPAEPVAPPQATGQPSGEAWAPPADYPAPGEHPAPAQPASAGEAWAPPAEQPAPGQPASAGEAWAPPGEHPAPGQPSGDTWGAPAGTWAPPVAPADAPVAGGYGPPGPGYGAPPGYGTPGPPGYGAPAAPPGRRKSRGLLVLVALLAVVAVGAAAFVVLSGGGDEDEEVVLEPITSVQQDDFTGNLDTEQLGASYAMASSQLPAFGSDAVATLASRTVTGTEPGLYGGTQDAAVCNTDQMIAFLTDPANADKAEAWADTQGIAVSEIESYIGGLTSVRLRVDTRVTNHGFRDGEANAFQSLLQAGTAVLVDDQGVPRAKCNCGNPLLEPEESGGGEADIAAVAQNPEDAWEGLDPTSVATVAAGDAVEAFTLVDNADGTLFSRPAGSNGDADDVLTDFGDLCETFDESPTCGGGIELGTGDMQVTLQWESSADLDLHVTEPDGTELYWQSPGPSASGGQLDVDSNIACEPDGSVENVYWSGAPPSGDFAIEVNGYDVGAGARDEVECGGGDYTLTIKVAGRPNEVHEGSVADEESDSYPVTL
jgi:hypothetical protein